MQNSLSRQSFSTRLQESVMGINSFSPSLLLSVSPPRLGAPNLSILLAPVRALAAFFMPAQSAQASRSTCDRHTAAHFSRQSVSGLQISTQDGPKYQNTMRQTPAIVSVRPVARLKVIREFDPAVGRSRTGRMAISGTMADVCAELERIALKESRA